MWFGVLGPLLVRDGDSVIEIPARRQRVLLAALLLRAGAVVPAGALAEAVWDGMPPAGAETTLRSHVMRLRRVLGPVAGARVATRYPGYLIEAGEDEVDLLRFRRLCREGGMAVRARDWARAWEMLTEALELWRGEPLTDIPSELLRRDEALGLEELRLQAVEWRLEAGLELGRHAELVPELRSLAREYPLRERFAVQLMLALVRGGRQAEALEAYQHARGALVEQLGTEPGADLRRLHQRVLTADPTLAAPPPRPTASEAVRPRELPASVAGFLGREEELAALSGFLDRSAERTPPAIVISAIGGTAGVGKTTLAVQWAHRVAERFPDGQLYVNLRGYDPDQPMTAGDALAGFLRALGVGSQDIPAEEDERAARYRSLLAGRRLLVVLDNARSAEQVRPLLPGSPSCAVVVTSRDSLAGLVARDGAMRLELDLLPLDKAVSLLRVLIGGPVDDDPGTAATMAEQCCRLPLALRVAAELAATRPDVPLSELVGELADRQRRLELLDVGGDIRTAVRAVFSWSLQHLDANVARAFQLLGLHPGADFDAYAATALTGTGLEEARRELNVLTRVHLIQMTRPDRYAMHDLLRAYARELAGTRDRGEEQREALTGLFDYYLHTASMAMDTLYPAERHRRPGVPAPAGPIPPVTVLAAARAWLDAERASLVAVTVHAAGHAWSGHAIRLSEILFRYLDSGCYRAEAIIIHTQARAAARQTGDSGAEAAALNALGTVDSRQGRYRQAGDHLEQALALFRRVGDRIGEARALDNLGGSYCAQGRYSLAISLREDAISVFRQIGDRIGEAHALGNLAATEEEQGRHEEAARRQQQCLTIALEMGLVDIERSALVNLGSIRMEQGRYQQATGHLHQALALCRAHGDRRFAGAALTTIGEVYLRQGNPQEATGFHHEALELFREIGDRHGEAYALNGLGEALLALGELREARAQHTAALDLADQIGSKAQRARAHNGLAATYQVTSDLDQARRHWQVALALYQELNRPEANQVRAQLAAAGHNSQPEQEASPAR
jgi:DNA-binding SARP family transcriptional activator/tetratricopeptide (TPR) repeat protein